MTLDEAIQHFKDVAKGQAEAAESLRYDYYEDANKCDDCAEKNEQLAAWLTELKQRRENKSHWIDRDGVYVCANCGGENGVMTTFCPDCGYEMDGDSP